MPDPIEVNKGWLLDCRSYSTIRNPLLSIFFITAFHPFIGMRLAFYEMTFIMLNTV